MIRCSVLSDGSRRTSKSTAPQRFSVPLKTASPLPFSTGIASPVSADSSLALRPASTSPSAAKASPGFTRNRSPVASASTGTSSSESSARRRVARLGDVFRSAPTSRCVRSSAYSSMAPEAENRNSSSTASPQASMNIAPKATASMRKWMSISRLRRFFHASTAASQPPARMPARNSTFATHGCCGRAYDATSPATPAPPQIAASQASVRHSCSSGAGSALISGHSISRHSQSFSAVTQVSRPTIVAPPSRRREKPAGAGADVRGESPAATAASVAASFSSRPGTGTAPREAIDQRCAAGSIRTAVTPGSARRNSARSATQSCPAFSPWFMPANLRASQPPAISIARPRGRALRGPPA